MKRSSWVRADALCLAVALVLLASSASAEAAKPITGKLSKRGYTVIALDARGSAKSVVAKRGRFKLRPPSGRVTLHLRAPNGTYAGPIVVRSAGGGKGTTARSARRKGKKKGKNQVIVGVKAGARLGKVKVKPGKGFALAKAVAARSLDAKRTAAARKGAPIGAGNFGRVRVRKQKGPGSDRDRDGTPTSLDIDDDGDLVLDDVDSNSAGGASAFKAQQQGVLGATAFLALGLTGGAGSAIVNANAPGLDDTQIQSGLRTRGILQVSTGPSEFSGELDCGVLVYCTAGGTGKLFAFQFDPNPQPYPACCDPDGDGLGSIQGTGGLALLTGAGADEIRAGNLLLARGTAGGEQQELAATLNTIFVTVPAIASYVDELGATHTVPYPVDPHSTVLQVVDGGDAGSDVSVTLTFWRPQRTPIPDELPPGAGRWIDIGGLQHYASGPLCPQSSYTVSDPNLTLGTGPVGGSASGIVAARLSDSATDQAASPANTFTYTLNLTECLASGTPATTFNPGEARNFNFRAALTAAPVPGPFNAAESNYTFKNQP